MLQIPERQPDDALVVGAAEPIEDNNYNGESSGDEAEVVHWLRSLHMHNSFETLVLMISK